ncbi:hypothetical protein BaRGS_00005964 [Batillaria attramentaria]|uniref:Major facilitator superfamily (MFS) profile domain-containing protein n=1 Tax=Batillaria attramentaria TaxID=370345 RepID=A0ABD0LSZ9_9CAEN
MAATDDKLMDVAYKSDDEEEDGDDVPLIDNSTVAAGRRKCVLIELPVFLYFMSLVTGYPVVQFYLFDWFSEQYGVQRSQNDTNPCGNLSAKNHSSSDAEVQVQTKTSQYVMYMSFITNFTAIIPTLLLGILTDRFGRKFVFYVSSLGMLASQILTIAVFHWKLSPNLLFLANLFMGLSGSFGLFLAAVFGIVADLTSPGKERAVRVTTMEAAIAIASSAGIAASGIWVKHMGYIWPMVFAASLNVVALVYVVFFVRETLGEHQHQPFSCLSLIRCFEFYFKDTPNKRRFRLVICLICFMITIGCFMGEVNFNMLYLLHQPFCWDKTQITVFNGVLTLIKWITVVTFIQLGKRWISEPVFAIIGSTSLAAGYLLRGLAWSDLLIYVGAGVSVLTELVSPMTRTMMSKAVSASEQGALFAGIGVLQMVVSSVSGITLSAIYNVGLKVFLGLPYMVIAGVACINIVLLTVLIIRIKRNPQLGQSNVVHEQVIN